MLAGEAETIARSVRVRRSLGGAMRQVGIFGAAALYALEHNVERLADDHANARLIGERLAASSHIEIELDHLDTNIIVFHLRPGAPDAAAVVAMARQRGVLLNVFGSRIVRAVTHLDVDRAACERGADVIAAVVEGRAA